MQNNSAGFFNQIPPVTRSLIIINLLALFANTLLAKTGFDVNSFFGLHYVTSDLFRPHQIITYMFMHGDFWHLFFNMFAVFMFGRVLESVWGSKRFLTYYLLTGIGAALIQLLVYYLRLKHLEGLLPVEALSEIYQRINTEGLALLLDHKNYADPALGGINGIVNSVMVGASGAVFGILVAFGMMFPEVRLMLLFPPIPIKAKWFVIGYGVLELVFGIADRPDDNVAHFAHLGGLLVGFVIMMFWRQKAKNNGNFHR
ncbi:rhomboid family intramembrane serine protease [Dysgonomonas sp. 25]|uniref:rhomboid family intramembrane serine protease n=1 Tax=Dysgonomonas sp. 25 TaxID=2302933 RepID=UPI0013D0ABF0|nr:rhomboid family intramembrane serine protease [Dysgonomonas sp. 25]NDV69493.1 rhomboid family intramembrane serine protease [Dysgonomonas sp. 25]